jgi:carbon-monoxide dehydrogenase large subunit
MTVARRILAPSVLIATLSAALAPTPGPAGAQTTPSPRNPLAAVAGDVSRTPALALQMVARAVATNPPKDAAGIVGAAVAAVIAESEAMAADAAADVAVDWELLPAVTDPFAAMADGAPQLFDDAPRNIEHRNQIKSGDPDAVFSRAKRVVRQRMVSQRLCGVPLEGRATVAAPDGTTGGLVVWATHQAPHNLRNDLAAVLGMPQNMIRVIAPEVGGGFGVKFGIYAEDATLAALARLFNLPLKWVETRVEHMLATTHGRAQVGDLEAAVEDDGTITALRMRVTADIGAYPVFTFIPDLTLMMGVGVYRIPNVDLQSTCVFTNTTTVAAYRGAGQPLRGLLSLTRA